MMPLPAARNMWPCKTPRKQGYGTCDQLLYQSTTKKYVSGKYAVLNAEDGRGGKKDEPHVCPDRLDSEYDHTNRNVDWKAYHKAQENLPCTFCGGRYNSYLYPLCPVCFTLDCRKCNNHQTWINKEGIESQVCSQCGSRGMDVSKIHRSEITI